MMTPEMLLFRNIKINKKHADTLALLLGSLVEYYIYIYIVVCVLHNPVLATILTNIFLNTPNKLGTLVLPLKPIVQS